MYLNGVYDVRPLVESGRIVYGARGLESVTLELSAPLALDAIPPIGAPISFFGLGRAEVAYVSQYDASESGATLQALGVWWRAGWAPILRSVCGMLDVAKDRFPTGNLDYTPGKFTTSIDQANAELRIGLVKNTSYETSDFAAWAWEVERTTASGALTASAWTSGSPSFEARFFGFNVALGTYSAPLAAIGSTTSALDVTWPNATYTHILYILQVTSPTFTFTGETDSVYSYLRAPRVMQGKLGVAGKNVRDNLSAALQPSGYGFASFSAAQRAQSPETLHVAPKGVRATSILERAEGISDSTHTTVGDQVVALDTPLKLPSLQLIAPSSAVQTSVSERSYATDYNVETNLYGEAAERLQQGVRFPTLKRRLSTDPPETARLITRLDRPQQRALSSVSSAPAHAYARNSAGDIVPLWTVQPPYRLGAVVVRSVTLRWSRSERAVLEFSTDDETFFQAAFLRA
jgi:hypothetical protein